jgi:Vitamin B6 photo-protection and homoeostasis
MVLPLSSLSPAVKRCCWVLFLCLLLTPTASCLATSSIPNHLPSSKNINGENSKSNNNNNNNNNGNDEKDLSCPKTVIVSTQKNGGHSQIYPSHGCTTSTSSNVHSKQPFQANSLAGMIRKGRQNVQSAIRSTFLPSGYPSKTPPGYLRYSMWSWIQDTSTQLRSVLATQRILEGVGVGREGATALSALMNFLARDGCGMIATLLFTSVASSRFRSDVKRWRLVADIAVDIGITLEIAAVAVPTNLFLPMICLGNMCKAICGVAAGACSGSINLHWAQGSDISDINAKFGAQHTVTGGLGLIFAALFARSVASWKLWKLWTLYSGLTMLHIVANMKCMRLIALQSLNGIRMNIIVQDFLKWWDQQSQAPTGNNISSTSCATPMLSTPSQVTKIEPLFFLPNRLLPRQNAIRKLSVPIFLGVAFNDFCDRSQLASGAQIGETMLTAPCELLDTAFGTDDYLISAGVLSSSKRKLCVSVVFRPDASPTTEAKAYLHALLLARRLKELEKDTGVLLDKADPVLALEAQANDDISVAWNLFQAGCQVAGWDLERTEMQTLGYEVAISAFVRR